MWNYAGVPCRGIYLNVGALGSRSECLPSHAGAMAWAAAAWVQVPSNVACHSSADFLGTALLATPLQKQDQKPDIFHSVLNLSGLNFTLSHEAINEAILACRVVVVLYSRKVLRLLSTLASEYFPYRYKSSDHNVLSLETL